MDTLRSQIDSTFGTALKGVGGVYITLWEALPMVIRMAIGIATFIHICVLIRKDLK